MDEGKIFVWHRGAPEGRPYWDACRDNYYTFNRSLCAPLNQVQFRHDSKLSKLRAHNIRPLKKRDFFGGLKQEPENETSFCDVTYSTFGEDLHYQQQLQQLNGEQQANYAESREEEKEKENERTSVDEERKKEAPPIDLSIGRPQAFNQFRDLLRISSDSLSSALYWGLLFTSNVSNMRPGDLKKKNEVESHSGVQVEKRQKTESSKLLGIGFSCNGQSYFLPLPLDSSAEATSTVKGSAFVPLAERWSLVKEFLQCTARYKVCFDSQQALKHLYLCNEDLRTVRCYRLFDPKIAAWMFCPSVSSKEYYNFSALVSKYLGSTVTTGTIESQFWNDLFLTGNLMQVLTDLLEENQLMPSFESQEMEMPSILARMEVQGISLEVSSLTKYRENLQSRLKLLEKRAAEWAGHPFLLSSPDQVARVLYDELQLPKPSSINGQKRTPIRHASTSEDALASFAGAHELPGIILEYRHLTKLISTYIDPFTHLARLQPQQSGITPELAGIHKIHTKWSQFTATGRLASVKPNLQSLPRSHHLQISDQEIMVKIRDAFVARPDHIFLSADYSQMEMRILACVSGDSSLQQFFRDGNDIFNFIASRLWLKTVTEIGPEERESAKRICYGAIYGAGSTSLAKELKISEQSAKQLIQKFKDKFPKVEELICQTKARASRHGYVRTVLGRWRPLPEINSSNSAEKAYAQRQSVNSLIQGTASDIVKKAMILIDQLILENQHPFKLLLQIHDELVFEVPKSAVSMCVGVVRDAMEQAGRLLLGVGVPVTLRYGQRLGSLEDITNIGPVHPQDEQLQRAPIAGLPSPPAMNEQPPNNDQTEVNPPIKVEKSEPELAQQVLDYDNYYQFSESEQQQPEQDELGLMGHGWHNGSGTEEAEEEEEEESPFVEFEHHHTEEYHGGDDDGGDDDGIVDELDIDEMEKDVLQ